MEADRTYRHGMYLIFTNQIQEANELIGSSHEDDPDKALLHAFCCFMEGIASQGDSILQDALVQIWDAERIGELDGSLRGLVVRAHSYLLGCGIQLATEMYLKGAWNLRKSWNLYEETRKQLEKYEGEDKAFIQSSCDAGIGVFNLLISLLPSSVVRLAEWLGFSGDREIALHLLNRSFETQSANAPFSAFFLLAYYVNLAEQVGDCDPENQNRAQLLLDWAEQTFPGGVFFAALHCRFERFKGCLRESIRIAKESGVKCDETHGMRVLFTYQEAWCRLLLMEYDQAIVLLGSLIQDGSSTSNFQGIYSYMCGLLYLMLQEKEQALNMFRQVPRRQYKKLKPLDHYVKRKAAKYVNDLTRMACLSQGMLDLYELVMHSGSFSHMDEELLLKTRSVLETLSLTEQSDLSRLHLFQGYISFRLGELSSSRKSVQLSLEHSQSPDDKMSNKNGIPPHGYYVLARICMAQSDFQAATESLAKGETYADYELVRIMRFRLQALRQTLELQSKA